MNLDLRRAVAVGAVALTVGVLAPAAALADSGVPANVLADIAKTSADVQTLHDTIVADASKIDSDVQSLTGSTDKASVRATLKADWQKLRADRKSENATIQADLQVLRTDWKAAHAAKQGIGRIKPLVKAMHSANQALRTDLRQAVQSARQATQALRQSLKG